MSVLDVDLVDYIYLDDENETPVLVVTDPLTWKPPEDERHLDVLRDKLNSQIAFIETGQIKTVWPKFDGRLVRVEVIGRCPLTDRADEFYDLARQVMTRARIELRFQLLDA